MSFKKKIVSLGLIALLAVSSLAYGADVYVTDKWDAGTGVVRTTSGSVKASEGVLYSVTAHFSVFTSSQDTLSFKDSLTDSGTSLLTLKAPTYDTTTKLYKLEWSSDVGIKFGTGIYCKIDANNNPSIKNVNVVYK